MIEYSLFILIFRILARFRNWGPQKKKNKTKQTNSAAHKWAYFLSTGLSGPTHFVLYGPSQIQKLPAVFLVDLRSYVGFFWWTGPTTKWVCTRLFLYGPSLDPLVKKERASERAKQTHSRDVHREESVQGWCVERLLLP